MRTLNKTSKVKTGKELHGLPRAGCPSERKSEACRGRFRLQTFQVTQRIE